MSAFGGAGLKNKNETVVASHSCTTLILFSKMIDLITNNLEAIQEACKKHHVKELYVFGSAASGNFTDTSDIDFLYSINLENFPNWADGQYDYNDNIISLENYLKLLLKRDVDLIPADVPIMNKYMQMMIEKSKQKIYAA